MGKEIGPIQDPVACKAVRARARSDMGRLKLDPLTRQAFNGVVVRIIKVEFDPDLSQYVATGYDGEREVFTIVYNVDTSGEVPRVSKTGNGYVLGSDADTPAPFIIKREGAFNATITLDL